MVNQKIKEGIGALFTNSLFPLKANICAVAVVYCLFARAEMPLTA
jgi:hypothetical protein